MPLAAQIAKARARQRPRPARTVAPEEPLELTAADVAPAPSDEAPRDEAPFEPPPLDDIFGLNECEADEASLAAECIAPEPPPFDDEAPFDPPEFDDEPVFRASAPAPVSAPTPPHPAPALVLKTEAPPRERPLPAMKIYASWDRPEAETLMRALAADPRLGRAEIEIVRGGLDGAASYCAAHEAPDLLILDTTLHGAAILAGLDRVRAAAPRAAIVVIGGVNDITLLRELAARGVAEYVVPPASADALASSLCRMFTNAAPAHVIAVIGARGGVGASTIAHNLAFSIAERQRAKTTLVDCDLSAGSAAFQFQRRAPVSVADVLAAGDEAEDTLSHALEAVTPRLNLLCAPERIALADVDVDAFSRALAELRRTAAYVVLDLPHLWAPWVRAALREADEVVIVAAPDLASLRNADNMAKWLRGDCADASPHVVLSMAAVPKRPEIPLKDFAEAMSIEPTTTFAFEPELFARAADSGQMIYEAMPDAKAALQLDTLASLLTGRPAHAKPERRGAPPPGPKCEQQPAPTVTPLTHRKKPRAARTGFVALQQPPPPRRSTGLVRAAMAMLALAGAGLWHVQQSADAQSAGREATLSPS
jgi:pilus assembly protein CpaE